MKDIARRLGVSQATVSHVLRGRDSEFRISAETASRIHQVAKELGYRPSALARNFKSHRSGALCLAVGNLGNPFWAALALGAQQEAESQGYLLVVTHTGETEEKEILVVDMLRERRVDGIILTPAHHKPSHLAMLRSEGLPFVFVDRTIEGMDVPSVVTDSILGLKLAVDHLVARGHRHIAFLGGPVEISTFRDRLRGFKQAVAHHRLRPGPLLTVARSDPEAGQQEVAALFRGGESATALIAADQFLTIGALRAAPEDVVVVGFDDLHWADLLRRPVTTIAQPIEELGREAVKLLVEEIAEPGGSRQLVLPPRLIVRGGGRAAWTADGAVSIDSPPKLTA
jgi:LacI family transcriptional regulator